MEKEENLPTDQNEEPVESDVEDQCLQTDQNDDPVQSDVEHDKQSEEEKDESVDRLKSKLDDAYGKQDDLKSKYLRAVADLENLRKRSIRDREDAVQRTRSQIISDLLPVICFSNRLCGSEKLEPTSFAEGFSMAMTLMEKTLSEYGLKVIDPTGESFDAKLHEAIGYEESDD